MLRVMCSDAARPEQPLCETKGLSCCWLCDDLLQLALSHSTADDAEGMTRMARERAIHLQVLVSMLQVMLRRCTAQAAAPLTPATDAALTRRRVCVMLHSCTPQRLSCWWAELLPRVLKLRETTYLRCLLAVYDNNADRCAGDDADVAAN